MGTLAEIDVGDSAAKYAVINTAATDTTIVAAVSGKRIRVTSVALVASGGANTIRFESGTGGTALTGQMSSTGPALFCLPYNPVGWFVTADSALLNLELAAATNVSGCITYSEVD
jgi:hypothetical protein